MYAGALILHSWIRWVVIVLAVVAVWRTFAAASSQRWTPGDERAIKLFSTAFDVQVLIGLLLFFWLSPNIRGAIQHASEAMRQPQLRFWLVEHPVGMLAAVIVIHIARARMRRSTEALKGRNGRLFLAIGLLLLLGSIPWPGLPYGRPLFRW